jgi:hypothetical protein
MKTIVEVLLTFAATSTALAEVAVGQLSYNADCEVKLTREGDRLSATWPIADRLLGNVVLDLSGTKPLIERIATHREGHEPATIVSAVDPAYFLTVGTRVMPPGKPPEQKWQVFFDNPHRRPHQVHT